MSKVIFGLVVLVMFLTSFYQFFIIRLSIGHFTWAAAGSLIQLSILLLIVAIVEKSQSTRLAKVAFYSVFFFLFCFTHFFKLRMDIPVAVLLLSTSSLYLLSFIWFKKYNKIVLSAFVSSLSFYLVTMIVLPFFIYLQILPIVWHDQEFVIGQFFSQSNNVLFALYGAGPSISAVLVGGYFAKRT